jgi:phosphoglycolate phosphatase
LDHPGGGGEALGTEIAFAPERRSLSMPTAAGSMLYAERYDLFVFDLDGTLADTREDIAASVNHALLALGRPPSNLETVTRFIGNGAPVLLRRVLGGEAPEDQVEKGLRLFLEHYAGHCLDRSALYPQVGATVEKLAASGKKLAVLSNKPTGMSLTILSGLGIANRFLRIDGGDRHPAKKPDPGGLREIMAALGAAPERTLMVGDSAVDVATARAAGTGAAGVLWGFKPEEVLADPPEHLLESMQELLLPIRSRRDGLP